MLEPQYNYTNLSSAAGLGLIGLNENDILVDYGCMRFDSLVYASRLCKKVVGYSDKEEKFKNIG